MADETEAAKKLREEEKAAATKAEAEKAEAAKKAAEEKAQEEAAAAKKRQEEDAARDASTSGETSSPQRAPSLLDQILAQNTPEPTFVPTYNQNRWKVGEGHSMLGQWVEGEEVQVEQLIYSLGKTEERQRAGLERLIRLGAITRMGDHEPQGGRASGHLAPLSSNQGATVREEILPDQILMGPDMRERIDGQATRDEVRRQSRGV